MTATPLSEFWLAIVSTFGDLYKADLSVSIPRHDRQTPPNDSSILDRATDKKILKGHPDFLGQYYLKKRTMVCITSVPKIHVKRQLVLQSSTVPRIETQYWTNAKLTVQKKIANI